jgi:MFS family permease
VLLSNSISNSNSISRFGRRKALLGGILLEGLSGVASGLVPEIYSLIFARFLLGMASMISYGSLFVLSKIEFYPIYNLLYYAIMFWNNCGFSYIINCIVDGWNKTRKREKK